MRAQQAPSTRGPSSLSGIMSRLLLVCTYGRNITSRVFSSIRRVHSCCVSFWIGGNHHCNGLNGAANTTPGPTCTTALADAAALKRFSFDGTFDSTFDDFFITSIAGVSETSTEFWGLLLNYQVRDTHYQDNSERCLRLSPNDAQNSLMMSLSTHSSRLWVGASKK